MTDARNGSTNIVHQNFYKLKKISINIHPERLLTAVHILRKGTTTNKELDVFITQ